MVTNIDKKKLVLACSSVKWSVKRLAPSFSIVTKEIVYLCPKSDLKGNSDSTFNVIGNLHNMCYVSEK